MIMLTMMMAMTNDDLSDFGGDHVCGGNVDDDAVDDDVGNFGEDEVDNGYVGDDHAVEAGELGGAPNLVSVGNDIDDFCENADDCNGAHDNGLGDGQVHDDDNDDIDTLGEHHVCSVQ